MEAAKEKGPVDKKLSARQFKGRTSVSSRLVPRQDALVRPEATCLLDHLHDTML
jgi:hypothetical protein